MQKVKMALIALCTNDVMKFQTPPPPPPRGLRQTKSVSVWLTSAVLWMAVSSLRSLTVLTVDDGVPGCVFKREPQEYTGGAVKRWFKCRGMKLSGKRDELVERVKDCINTRIHHTLYPSIWWWKIVCAKVLWEISELPELKGFLS